MRYDIYFVYSKMQMKYAISNFYAHMILNDFIVRKILFILYNSIISCHDDFKKYKHTIIVLNEVLLRLL